MAKALHTTGLLQSISPAERERIAPYLDDATLRSGQVLVTAGEPVEAVYFPEDCVTSTVVDTVEGRTIEVGLMGMEGLVGLSLLLGQGNSNTTVVVEIPGTARCMDATDFVRHVVQPRGELYDKLLEYVDVFMAMVAQTAACNSLHSIDERFARWILLTYDRVNRDSMPLTQEFISYMLGVRRASVSMSASALQHSGVIEYSRGELRVRDREGLEQRACPCYKIMRALSETLYRRTASAA